MKKILHYFSPGLNVLLLAAILFVLRKPVGKIAEPSAKVIPDIAVTQIVETVVQTNSASPASPDPFDWSQLESEDFLVYAENLRGIACPEPTVRDILTAEINQLFVQRRQNLFRPLQNQYWDLMAQGREGGVIGEEIQKQLDTLEEEKKALFKKVFRGARGDENLENRSEYEAVLSDALPPEKVERLQSVAEKFRKRREEIESSELAGPEKQKKFSALNAERKTEQERLLSPEELQEFKLRQSPFAQQIHGLVGMEISEEESRRLALLALDVKPKANQKVQEKFKTVLGEKRFGEFLRSTNANFQNLYRVGRRYDLSQDTIATVYELERAVQQQAETVRRSNFTEAQREESLEEIRRQTEQAMIAHLGARAAETYRRNGGDWDKIPDF